MPNTSNPIIVDPSGKGQFVSLTEAVAAASDGNKILMRSGDYRECVVVDKSLEISGDGSAEDVRIVGPAAHVLRCTGAPVTLKNLTIVAAAGGSAVRCESGILEMNFCTVEGGSDGIYCDRGTRVLLDSCHICDCSANGILADNARVISVADSLIESCGECGLLAKECETVLAKFCTFSGMPRGIDSSGEMMFEVSNTEFENNSDGPIYDGLARIAAEPGHRLFYQRK